MELDNLYRDISLCTNCSFHQYRVKTPFGGLKSGGKVMIVGQAPGEKENLTGRLFVGPSGKMLDELFDVNGISRDEVYMTNLIKCFVPHSKRIGQTHIDACSKYLDNEIALIHPSVIATMGYLATKYVYEKYTSEILSKPDIHNLVGKVYRVGETNLLALPHPSALIYNDSLRGDMIRNYHKLKVLIDDCKYYPFCSIKKLHEKGAVSDEWVELYCRGDWESCIRFRMEEQGLNPSDWMLPDGKLDERLKHFCD